MDTPTLYRNRFHLHLEEQGDDGLVLIKEPSNANIPSAWIAELRNEFDMCAHLSDVSGVRHALAIDGADLFPRLVLEYIEGQTLAETIKASALTLTDKLNIACEISATLAEIHEHQVMHRDVSSSNILIADDYARLNDRTIYFIDFGVACPMGEENPPRVRVANTLSRTLAYISPEQTGRINRAVDYRTDLYSLGVTLYELLTGILPFQTDDALEMLHCHIPRQPAPPHEMDIDIPLPLSHIILRLLAKNAEDRYQTARGLQADLMICTDNWQATGQVDPFELGQDDVTGRLRIPQKLYDRQTEIDQMLETFGRAANGRSELLLVSGYAGAGKTALVHEMCAPIVHGGGSFIEGKFDQYHRNIPYSAWTQAFSELIHHWLADDERRLNLHRNVTLNAVGHNGQVLIDLMPSLELVIGPQPGVPDLNGLEAENRLAYLFQRFVNAVATPDHPLVIFLDDIQWTDPASLNLFRRLLSDIDCRYVLLIGAYRDNEVDIAHPLPHVLNQIHTTGATVTNVAVKNLGREHVAELLSDTLSLPRDRCLSLSQLLYEKANGNAFFTRQLLQLIEEKGILRYDANSRLWQWDMEELKGLAVSDNVVELMVDRMAKLPETTQDVLKIAACLGNQFSPATLGRVVRQPRETLLASLEAAMKEHLIGQVGSVVRFSHDRIHQAAYSMVPDDERAVFHRRIGHCLLGTASSDTEREAEKETGASLFDIVSHLNLATHLIENERERHALIELNLKAAQASANGAAFSAAKAHADRALDLLGGNGWQTQYPLTLLAHQSAAEAAYLVQELEVSVRHADAVLAQARTSLDRIPAIMTKLHVLHARGEYRKAINTGHAAVNQLGYPIIDSAPPGLSVQAVRNLPAMHDPVAMAAMEILEVLTTTAYMYDIEHLFSPILYSALQIMLDHGLAPASSKILAWFAVERWKADIDEAHRYGLLSLGLVDEFDAKRYRGTVRTLIASFILHWKVPYRSLERELRSALQDTLEVGDKSYTAGCYNVLTYLACLSGRSLEPGHEMLVRNIELQKRTGEAYVTNTVSIWTQYVANLRGLADDPLTLDGQHFSETRNLAAARTARLNNAPFFAVPFLKLILHYHLGEHPTAYVNSKEAERYLPGYVAHLALASFHFYQSLTILQLIDGKQPESDLTERLERNVAKLRLWAKHAPMNHQHKVALVLAEQARVRGDVAAALDGYEAAIEGAGENKFRHEEALANELFGRFWHQRGNVTSARLYVDQARMLYARWGATAIVDYLDTEFPQWFGGSVGDLDSAPSKTDGADRLQNLDLLSILRSSQAVAGEIELGKLLDRLMTIAMENAGAQRGFLLLEEEERWLIGAAREGAEAITLSDAETGIDETNQLCAGVVRYVARTQKIVVLLDAANAGEFTHDSYIQHREVKSLLCLPLMNQGVTSAILYFENNLATSVFVESRVTLLKMLAGQMAISLDNSRMVEQLGESFVTRTAALESAQTQIRTLFESSPLGISLANTAGKILAVNRAMLAMTGYTEAEALERNAINFYYDPEQRTEFIERIETSGRVRDFGLRILRKDGTFFFANLSANELYAQHDSDLFMVVLEDVTDKVLTEQALQETNRNLVNLLESARTITVAFELDDLFKVILEQLSQVAVSLGALIWLREGSELVVQAERFPDGMESLPKPRIPFDALPSIDTMIVDRSSITIEDRSTIARLLQSDEGDTGHSGAEAIPVESKLLVVPLIAKDHLIGILGVLHSGLGYFAEGATDLVQAFANQAAVAIDNARLHQQLQQTAIEEERGRLARDLHDAVTQTIYSASMVADTVPGLWDKDPDLGRQYLQQLPRILRGALAEMRTLLLELRPGALKDQTLGQLLGLLAVAIESRSGASTTTTIEGDDRLLPEDVTVALHRVAQESLNNIAKHAEASQIDILLHYDAAGVAMQISDDGKGFDSAGIGPDRLGLKIMGERAAQIDAEISVDSSPGAGTTVTVSWSDGSNTEE